MAQRKQYSDFDFYDLLLLVLGLALAVILWYASMTFSVNGFKITQSGKEWIGWALGFTVTYLQIMFNRGAENETLHYFGIASYVYGVSTNLVGIIGAQNQVFSMDWLSADPGGFVLQLLIVVFLAAILEFVPEHLVVRLLRPGKNESDFMSQVRQGPRRFGGQRSRQSRPQQKGHNNKKGQQQKRKKQEPNYTHNHLPQIRPRPQPGSIQQSDIDDLIRNRGRGR